MGTSADKSQRTVLNAPLSLASNVWRTFIIEKPLAAFFLLERPYTPTPRAELQAQPQVIQELHLFFSLKSGKSTSWLCNRIRTEVDLWPWPKWPSQMQSQSRSMSMCYPKNSTASISENHYRLLTGGDSYEGLPPNFSLLQNMVAGAFAGIAVSFLGTQS